MPTEHGRLTLRLMGGMPTHEIKYARRGSMQRGLHVAAWVGKERAGGGMQKGAIGGILCPLTLMGRKSGQACMAVDRGG